MDAITVTQAIAMIFAAFTTALLALVLISRPRNVSPAPADAPQSPEIVFLFDGDTLVDASPAARRLLDVSVENGSDIARLVAFLTPRFPELHDTVMACNELDTVDLQSIDGLSLLRLRVGGGQVRLRIEDLPGAQDSSPDRHTIYALTDELATYRAMQSGFPVPVWRQSADGQLTWANAAYLALANRCGATGTLPKIFDLFGTAMVSAAESVRVKAVTADNGIPEWFDCTAQTAGSDFLFTAIPADRILTAEQKLGDFVQSLTQTFAHLSVGLAIFDRKRRLTLFNPALGDLFNLPPEFLISHPTLSQFLDLLRNRQMMPEPKNYSSWRRRMSELEAAAADGSYSETWSLVDGRTYRVTGRPHPDGAVAFLFEDITAEISLTHRFRSELETGQAVIDSLEAAIAVFSAAGYLIHSNRSYADLWQTDPSQSLEQINFLDATRCWQKSCNPTPIWADACDFAATLGERSNWTAEVHLEDGRRLCCRFESLPGGATLVGFSEPTSRVFSPQVPELQPALA